jgi:BirA family transcriptional regulator, biotin operon repressor / biotin---[acetyl-CoA-carboxylase] ligase
MKGSTDPLPADLAASLQATRSRRGAIGEPAYYFSETTSTNDVAAVYAEQGAPEGTTIVAASQTAGRGRLGRSWYSPPGAGLYMSVVLRQTRVAPYLTLAGGVAVAEGVRTATGLPLEIKWPNDVVTVERSGRMRCRKLAGVLAEASSVADGLQHVILGIGINLLSAAYPPDIADRATSIETELGRAVETGPVFGEILAALAGELVALSQGDVSGLLRRWRALAPSAHGSPVEFESAKGRVAGVAAGIAADGALLVRVGDRLERIISGEVIWK